MKVCYNIVSYAISHIGKVRGNNEDNFLLDNGELIYNNIPQNINRENTIDSKQCIECLYEKIDNKGIFAVADGMGGQSCGEVASFIAVRNLLEVKDNILKYDNIESSIECFQEYIEDANENILKVSEVNSDTKSMGTTLVSLIINNEKAALINLGDSTAFIYENNKLRKITRSHTEAQVLLDIGIISENEIKNLRIKNSLTRFLGMNEELGTPVGDVYQVDINSDMYFILCSDGLTDVVSEDKIEKILNNSNKSSIKSIGRKLVDLALIGDENNKGGRDNITVLIVKIENNKQ